MRGTVAKRIRREHESTGAHTKSRKYFRGDNGMVLADRDRRVYQMRKEKYYAEK
jgi:hypothetical protein